MQREIFFTEDSSATIAVPTLQATYHSKYGAVQESMHVFIEAGLKPLLHTYQQINILEVGFGTGLNALLTLQVAKEYNRQIFYYAVEPHPLTMQEVKLLNYSSEEILRQNFYCLHQCSFDEDVSISETFILHKSQTNLQHAGLQQKFHLIYFDAFDPTVQPELWTEEIFMKLYNCLQPGSELVTYCSKGAVQRAMKAAGFIIEKLKGPPHKREIIRARKNNATS